MCDDDAPWSVWYTARSRRALHQTSPGNASSHRSTLRTGGERTLRRDVTMPEPLLDIGDAMSSLFLPSFSYVIVAATGA